MEAVQRMIHYCTYCDRGYAARLLCLYDSLVAQCEPFRLNVLCFDGETETVVRAAGSPELVAIPLDELLVADPAYAAVRSARTVVEFFFTATPVLVRHCLQRDAAANQMTYLDSDLFFFGRPSEVLRAQGDASVGIVAHRFPLRLSGLLKWGTYNVAWVSFRRDHDGIACLEWWRERCLEWCHDRIDEQGRFADQGYLDQFPQRFGGVQVLNHPGINAGPWNMDEIRVSSRADRVCVNEQPLLFYHFQGIRELFPDWFESGLRHYRTPLTPELRELIYQPYLQKLAAAQSKLLQEHGIRPRLGYQRQPQCKSLQDCWSWFLSRWVLPYYRRCRGQLLRCPDSRARRSSPVI